MVMDQGDKNAKLSFASVAISFFILIVLPLTITGIVISKGVVKVGEEATQANLRVLDNPQKQSVELRAKNIAEGIAQFYTDREKDIKIASILPRDEKAYTTFLTSNNLGVITSSDIGLVKVPVPVYKEIAFLDKAGMEKIKITNTGIVPKNSLKDMSNPSNGEFGKEDYFDRAKSLAPGEFYIGPVVGYHVNRKEVDSGKKFEGIQRIATPVFDSSGFAGVIELALNFQHVREFVDHLVPTDPDKIFASVSVKESNFAFLVDRDGNILSHPDDTFIIGLDKNQNNVPMLKEENFKNLEASGDGYMNLLSIGFKDENLPKIHEEASSGKSGSRTYNLDNSSYFVAFAPVPYYGNGFSKPKGIGWVGMFVDVNLYHNLNQEKAKDIKDKVAKWQKSTILVVIVSLILLFLIALILSKGIHRQIKRVYEEEAVAPSDEEGKD
jgi:hypothetical protein